MDITMLVPKSHVETAKSCASSLLTNGKQKSILGNKPLQLNS